MKFWKSYGYALMFVFLILGLFDMRIALGAIICMLSSITLALLGRGRFWCGNLCPRGLFYDNIVSKFSNSKKVPKLIKSVYFRVLVIIYMFFMLGIGIYKNWGDLTGVGMVIYRMIVMTTLIGIILSFIYNNRTWCNFCPIGSIASGITKIRKNNKALSVSFSCVSCKLCEKKCTMGVVPYDYKGNAIEHPDCIQCGKCIVVCPKTAIK